MGERTQALVQHLLGKNRIEECDVAEMESLAARYPYFAPAQILLLQKLKSTNSDQYQKQLEKAILYYHNPLEFQYIINSDRFETALPDDVSLPQPLVEQPAPIEEKVADHPDVQEIEGTAIAENIIESREPEQVAEIQVEEITKEEQEPAEAFQEPEPVDDIKTADATQHHAEETPEEVEPALDEEVEIEQEISLPVEDQPKTDVFTRISKEAHAEPKTGFTFEPYHAVDYFASQGIKLSQEDAGKDKFGKQLKSFTEWLKTMKRLPATQIAVNIDSTSEHKVQHMAQHSINEADVFTEAMAEVWEKQGNREKAEEVYNKLSLLYPSKKTYFAAKIENLKHS